MTTKNEVRPANTYVALADGVKDKRMQQQKQIPFGNDNKD